MEENSEQFQSLKEKFAYLEEFFQLKEAKKYRIIIAISDSELVKYLSGSE